MKPAPGYCVVDLSFLWCHFDVFSPSAVCYSCRLAHGQRKVSRHNIVVTINTPHLCVAGMLIGIVGILTLCKKDLFIVSPILYLDAGQR